MPLRALSSRPPRHKNADLTRKGRPFLRWPALFVFERRVSTLELLRSFSQFQTDLFASPPAIDRQFQHVSAVFLVHQAFERLFVLNWLPITSRNQVAANAQA